MTKIFQMLNILNCNIHVVVGKKEKLIKYIKNNFEGASRPTIGINTNATCIELVNQGRYDIVIWVREKREESYLVYKSLAVHEIVHAVDFMFDYYGLECSELRAYVTQSMYCEIVGLLDEYLAKKDKNDNK